jgi:nucleotide-binding universal stress UspA family protein
MALFKRILFPVDFSEASEKMVPYVKEVVDRFGAELHIVHATIDRYHIAEFVNEIQTIDMEEEEKNIRKFINSHFKNLSIQSKILPGPPGPEIIEYCQKENLDLVIMGHSSTGLARAVFGSVAGYVVKHSHVPVLIISSSILQNKI